jgi:DUF971 family protein
MPVQPTTLTMTADGRLRIAWSDGAARLYTVRELREHCPCATCRETHGKPAAPPSLLPVLSAAEARPLALLGMKPVGHYAYAIHFSDGHDTGIYTFDLLRELGTDEK